MLSADSSPSISQALCEDAPELSTSQLKELTRYRVPAPPTAGSDAPSCGGLLAEPFDMLVALRAEGADATHPEVARLWRLKRCVELLAQRVGCEWLGVYRKTEGLACGDAGVVLLKEAYVGRPSRATFPLTDEFAKNSNNSKVGLTKQAVLVDDVAAHAGPYYQCDADVRSEYCAPIVRDDGTGGELLGIIDAEAFAPNFFTPDRCALIDEACVALAASGLMRGQP